jgi:hypothetical protein
MMAQWEEKHIGEILYNEAKNAQLIDYFTAHYYTAAICFDTIVSSSGSS